MTVYRRNPSRWQWLGFGVLIVVILLILTWPALHLHFLSDEYDWLRNARLAVTSGDWLQPFTTSTGGNFFRPIVSVGFQIDYALNGATPFGYHVHQLVAHIALVLGIAWVVFLLFGSRMLGFATALLFALWPSQHEVVTWLAGRPDLYATLFTVYALASFLMHLRSKRWGWYVASCGFALLGYLSKETAFVLPALLFGAGLLVIPRRSWKAAGRLALLAFIPAIILGGVLAIRSHVLSDAIGGYLVGGERSGTNFSTANLSRPFTSGFWWVNWTYALDRFGSAGIVGALHRVFTWFVLKWWLLLSVGVAGALIWVWRRPLSERRNALLAGLGWAVIAFIPVYGLSGAINSSLNASRLFFASSCGFALIFAAGIIPLAQGSRGQRAIRLTVFIGLCMIFSVVWRFNLTPWRVASDKMGQVTHALQGQQEAYLANNPTHLFVEKLPMIVDGAYVFFGRVPIAEVFTMVTGREDIQVYNVGEYAFPTSPFCERPEGARFSRIAWDAQARVFEIADASSVANTLEAARMPVSPVTWDFSKPETVASWDFGAYAHEQQPDGVVVDFGTEPAQELTSSAFHLTAGPGYRWLTVTYHVLDQDASFGWRRARVRWGAGGVFPARNKLSYSFADAPEGSYTVPLCEYVVWPLTTDIDQLKILPVLSGEVKLERITLSPERPVVLLPPLD
jgi:hypothetical protein